VRRRRKREQGRRRGAMFCMQWALRLRLSLRRRHPAILHRDNIST
jgi:hypothetical protein